MGKIIAIANQKGGVGKTTTAINLSSSIAYYLKKTLIVDLDPQANATCGLGILKENIKGKNIYDVLINGIDIEQAIYPVDGLPYLYCIPANEELNGAQIELVDVGQREFRLKQCLEKIKDKYNYIFIDCPPSLGLLTLNALVAADSVFIPVQCEYYSLEGLSHLLDTIQRIKRSLNPTLKIEGVLLTMDDARVNLSKAVKEEVEKFFPETTYKTSIPRNVRIAEAPSFGKPIIFYSADSKGAQAYLNVAQEFLIAQGERII